LVAACVFCGLAPESKTKEHVFPQWLLKMTGAHSKKTSVGVDWKTGKEIVFPAKNYTFPACDSCNNKFAKMEGEVKNTMERLQQDIDVTGSELELLLDWFDKIRVGTWLGIKYMNNEVFQSPPNFYISNRVGIKDRYLSITNTYRPEQFINWSGANTMTFMTSPTALTLRVNNIVYVTASSDFLVSKSLGFPFPIWEAQLPGSKIGHFLLNPGTKKVGRDCFKKKPYPPGFILRQSIFEDAMKVRPELYDNEFIRNNSYDFDRGIGKIFIKKNQKSSSIERDELVNFKMENAKFIYGHVPVVRPILELQIEMLKMRLARMNFINEDERRRQTAAANLIVSYTREQINQYKY
jgi:hypothetical protein